MDKPRRTLTSRRGGCLSCCDGDGSRRCCDEGGSRSGSERGVVISVVDVVVVISVVDVVVTLVGCGWIGRRWVPASGCRVIVVWAWLFNSW